MELVTVTSGWQASTPLNPRWISITGWSHSASTKGIDGNCCCRAAVAIPVVNPQRLRLDNGDFLLPKRWRWSDLRITLGYSHATCGRIIPWNQVTNCLAGYNLFFGLPKSSQITVYLFDRCNFRLNNHVFVQAYELLLLQFQVLLVKSTILVGQISILWLKPPLFYGWNPHYGS
jgi:hypothetical protein